MVRSADIYVLAGLLVNRRDWTYRSLASDLAVSHPVVQRALERAAKADLYDARKRQVHVAHFDEFANHALRFVAPASLGALTPGIPAAWGAEPMRSAIHSASEDPVPVWPTPDGKVRGQAIEPLHSSAPIAAPAWPELSEMLSVVDSLRTGNPRVRKVAGKLLAVSLRDATIAK